MSWPLAEVLAWQCAFDAFGPLDWRREDWRDARRHAFEYGKAGDVIGDHRFFIPARRRKTEAEEHIESLEQMLAVAAGMGSPEAVAQLEERIRMARQEQFRFTKRK